MIRILFVMTNLRPGGITSSLLNLLREISVDPDLKIDLLLLSTRNSVLEQIPQQVRLLPEKAILRCLSDGQREISGESKIMGIFRTTMASMSRMIGHELPYRIVNRLAGAVGEEYDVAISCTQSSPRKGLYGGCNEFILQNVQAKKYISFIHCDYLEYGLNDARTNRLYQRMDRIAVVSQSCREAFLQACPTLSEKTWVVPNCCSYQRIRDLSNENPMICDGDGFHFVTVARLGAEKGHLRTLSALQELKKRGWHFVWHVVGGGNEKVRDSIYERIQDYGLSEQVKLHGNQLNPYRFMKNCDFFLLPSFHEAAPMVFEEAAAVGLPVLTTRTRSAVELVEAKGIGFVCENSEEGIIQGLENLFQDPSLLQSVRDRLAYRTPDNREAVDSFYALLRE